MSEKRNGNPGLQFLFRPKSVAVVGASRKVQSVGGAVFSNLLKGQFQGPVYPVNRTAKDVQSVRAYASLEALPEVPELVVVAVPSSEVLKVVKSAAALGVRAAIVLTAGFREVGPEGALLEKGLLKEAQKSGMRILGPNCLGAQVPHPEVGLNATFAPNFAPFGKVALASQSGALGLAAIDYAKDLGIGISVFASLGNKADISGNDFLEYCENDEDSQVVLLYLESLGNPARFREIASRVSRKKPVALVKSGRSTSGARAAGSHTGALAGPDEAISALCQQTGVIRTDTLEELFDVAMVLANQPLPMGRRVAVVTNAGGPGILAADALDAYGLKVPRFSPATEEKLKKVLRPEASSANPVDILADTGPAVYREALALAAADSEIDAVMALYVPPITQHAQDMAKAIVEVAATATKPIVSCFMGSHGVPEALASLQEKKVPSFRFPEGAARALAWAVRYSEWRQMPEAKPVPSVKAPVGAQKALEAARSRLGPEGGWLNAEEMVAFSEAWELPFVKQRKVANVFEKVMEAASSVGFPVVLKADVEGLVHKTEAGAVALNLGDESALKAAFEKMQALKPSAFLVQHFVEAGSEWLLGMVRDATWGPLLAVGAGGVSAELWKDTHCRLAPLTEADVQALVEKPRIGKTLQGFRNFPKADVEALKKLIRLLSMASCAHIEVDEMEFNPVRVLAEGQGALALDFRVKLQKV